MTNTIEQRALLWFAGDDRGTSSETIARHMLGMDHDGRWGISAPADGSDLGRCLRLLRAIPEWRERMSEMAALSPSWAALAPHWGELEALLVSEIGHDLPREGRASKTYARIRELTDEARKTEGWITIKPGARMRTGAR